MRASQEFLGPAEAARRLGVSAKALRLYEKRGLIAPRRTVSGWRVYGPEQMERAAAIAAMRRLGLGLAEIRTMLDGDASARAALLAAHQTALEGQWHALGRRIARTRQAKAEFAPREEAAAAPAIAFALPWPWAGERFELTDIGPLTFITGPLFSGKTRLARAIAAALSGAVFIGADRTVAGDADGKRRTRQTIARLLTSGATKSTALEALVACLEARAGTPFVIDMVEHGLDADSQAAVIGYLRRRAHVSAPLFVMTRSTAVLDLETLGPEERIIYCPANHDAPMLVAPLPGTPGYEAVASCLGTPEARARTAGVVAVRTTMARGADAPSFPQS